MMNQPNNYRFASWKLLSIMPLLAILLMSFSLKIENFDFKKKVSEALPSFENIKSTDDKIYELSEVSPLPDGKRMKYFYENLFEHIEKTTGIKKDEIHGNAAVHFIVMKDGSLSDIKLIQGIKSEVDAAILWYVKEEIKWTPGLEVGQPVNVRMVLKIPFGKNDLSKNKSRRLMGKLINEQDFTAIVGARVKIKGTDIETITDEAGIFWLDIKPLHKELIISGNQIKPTSFEIHPKQTSLNYLIHLDDAEVATVQSDTTTNEVFSIVENQPYPLSGDLTSYYEEIDKDLNYPKEAKEKGIEGRVFVQFVVKKDGSLDDIKVVKGISQECDKEAVRVVKEGPGWIAGRQRGQAVNVRMILPITFISENKITGIVRSEDRKPIAGVNVIIKGTPTGTVTDKNGKFILQIEPDQSEIVIASVGYKSVIEKIVPGNNYDILLERDPNTPLPQQKTISENEGLLIKANGKNIIDPNEKPLYIIDGVEMKDYDERTLNPHDIESISILKDKKAAIEKYGEKGKNGVIIIETRPLGADRSKLDKMPDYSGGMEAFYKTIQKNIKYPSEARKENIQGEVLVSFTVTKDGMIKEVKAEKTEYLLLEELVVVAYSKTTLDAKENASNKELSLLEEEVIRNINQLAKFKPGIKDGKPVDVRMTLPVTFKLQ